MNISNSPLQQQLPQETPIKNTLLQIHTNSFTNFDDLTQDADDTLTPWIHVRISENNNTNKTKNTLQSNQQKNKNKFNVNGLTSNPQPININTQRSKTSKGYRSKRRVICFDQDKENNNCTTTAIIKKSVRNYLNTKDDAVNNQKTVVKQIISNISTNYQSDQITPKNFEFGVNAKSFQNRDQSNQSKSPLVATNDYKTFSLHTYCQDSKLKQQKRSTHNLISRVHNHTQDPQAITNKSPTLSLIRMGVDDYEYNTKNQPSNRYKLVNKDLLDHQLKMKQVRDRIQHLKKELSTDVVQEIEKSTRLSLSRQIVSQNSHHQSINVSNQYGSQNTKKPLMNNDHQYYQIGQFTNLQQHITNSNINNNQGMIKKQKSSSHLRMIKEKQKQTSLRRFGFFTEQQNNELRNQQQRTSIRNTLDQISTYFTIASKQKQQ